MEDVLRAEVGLELGSAGPGAEEVFILKEGVKSAEAKAEENTTGKGAALLARHQHVGAGRTLGKLKVVVLLDDELSAEGNHEQHAEKAANQGQHEDARVLEVKAEEDECWQGEDDARGDGLAGVSSGLDDDVLKN
jgi:hypothetical protein